MTMGLNLGHIAFQSDHTPYTQPEKRRPQRQRQEVQVDGDGPGGTARRVPPAALPGGGVPPDVTERGPASRLAELSIRPDTFGPVDERFLLGASRERMGRSVGASVVGHVVSVGIVLVMINLVPDIALVEPNRENYGVVWLPVEGPGGGGGGGGNESLELPRQVELQGPDDAALSIPVEPEPDYVEPEIEPEPEVLQTQQMNIPVLAMASALDTQAGMLEGMMASTTRSQGSGRSGGAGSGDGTGIGPGQGAGLGPGQGGGTGGGVYRPGSGIENPQLVREVKPRYTAEAMRAKVQGSVWLEVVVLKNGTVGDITVTKSLDRVFGLDEEAIKAARQWRFAPGTRFGEPVAVFVGIELSFTLR